MDKGAQEKVDSPLLSTEERRSIVRSFVDAYLRGAVRISFKLKSPDDMGQKPTAKTVYLAKTVFEHCLNVAAGSRKSTVVEAERAIEDLFNAIVAARIGRRIEGKFLGVVNLESRLASLDERITNVERLLEELQNLIRIRGQSQ